MSEPDRPGLVVFVVVTDGQESSSHEFLNAKIKKMERQQNVYNWQFTFLGANQDAFAEAGSMGFSVSGTAGYSPDKAAVAYANVGGTVAPMRKEVAACAPVDNRWTAEERESMKSSPG